MSLFERIKRFFSPANMRTVWESFRAWVIRVASAIYLFIKKYPLPVVAGSLTVVLAIVLLCVFTSNGNINSVDISVPANYSANGTDGVYNTILAPTPAPTATPVPTPTPTPTPVPLRLYNGYRGDIVLDVQQRLMELDYMDYDEPTELYGDITTEAVKQFQRRNELDITGELDQAIYDLLMSSNAKMYMAAFGDEGTDITEIQTRLYELDYIDSVTGYFGEVTEEAVKLFQQKNELTVDGKVGVMTKEKLYSEDATPNSLYLGSTGDDVKKYQTKLSTLGYLTTTPDGIYGKDTVSAVKRFQERNAIVVDGYLGPSSKELLMSGNAKSNRLEYTMSGSDVQRVQVRLHKLNYLRSTSATGYFGAVTDAAVRQFQANNGLTVDGKVGKATMKRLFSADAVKSSSTVDSGTPGLGSGDGGSIESFIAVAYTKLGARYVRGGKGPNTFDCSGFVYWCLNEAGVRQSYMTSYMWRTTTRYPRISSLNNVKRGDVLVFKMSSTKGHVGIALGDGMMIDASNRNGKVVVRSCTTTYWRNTFYCAYRIFGG